MKAVKRGLADPLALMMTIVIAVVIGIGLMVNSNVQAINARLDAVLTEHSDFKERVGIMEYRQGRLEAEQVPAESSP